MRINGVGCCLVDYLYTNFSFESESFKKLLSRKAGDGGINIGGLVFSEDLESYSGDSYISILKNLIGDTEPDAVNLGGPAVVSIIHLAQILSHQHHEVNFYGMRSLDSIDRQLQNFISRTPVHFHSVKTTKSTTPSTVVLSNPSYNNGKGERSFMNTIGAAGELYPDDLGYDFYKADILLFGGTALVPGIHKGLTDILAGGKESGCINVVGTVYDFRNEKKAPGKLWPLGNGNSFPLIDLLVMDAEEALKITGKSDTEEAAEECIRRGIGAIVITRGADSVLVWSGGKLFEEQELFTLPVSNAVADELAANPEKRGDTTGCGDNFLGGVTASLCSQLHRSFEKKPDIVEAASWGVVSGGFACFTKGGTYYETTPGEKRKSLMNYISSYRNQLKGRYAIKGII